MYDEDVSPLEGNTSKTYLKRQKCHAYNKGRLKRTKMSSFHANKMDNVQKTNGLHFKK